MSIKKEYSNEEITIIWQPDLCIHAGVCIRMLPEVYKPRERPWVKIKNATTEALIEQVRLCPSGALSFIKKENSAG